MFHQWRSLNNAERVSPTCLIQLSSGRGHTVVSLACQCMKPFHGKTESYEGWWYLSDWQYRPILIIFWRNKKRNTQFLINLLLNGCLGATQSHVLLGVNKVSGQPFVLMWPERPNTQGTFDVRLWRTAIPSCFPTFCLVVCHDLCSPFTVHFEWYFKWAGISWAKAETGSVWHEHSLVAS